MKTLEVKTHVGDALVTIPVRGHLVKQYADGDSLARYGVRALIGGGRDSARRMLEDWVEAVSIELLPQYELRADEVGPLLERVLSHFWISDRMLEAKLAASGPKPKPTHADYVVAWKIVREGGLPALRDWASALLDGGRLPFGRPAPLWIPPIFWAEWSGGLCPKDPLERAVLQVNVRHFASALRKVSM